MPKVHLEHLTPTEQQAVLEFVHLLQERFNGRVRSALLFGSRARGEGSPDSDLDVLVVIDSDDWRVHKQIRYLAADICLKYDLNLSPRVWSTSHRREMEELQTLLYQNIHRDGISLLELSPVHSGR
jgi:predicted nucleotidyltransferase